MAPKRKRTTDAEAPAATPSARATRSSTRAKKAADTEVPQATAVPTQAADVVAPEAPQPKKPRKAPAKTAKAAKAATTAKVASKAATSRSATQNDHDPAERGNESATDTAHAPPPAAPAPAPAPAPRQNASTPSLSSAKAVKPAKSLSIRDPEPYTAAHARALFSTYADTDDPSVIGPEGFERLCTDADIAMEGGMPLIMFWQFGASEMAKITKSEWEKGTAELQISSLSALSAALRDLEDLLLLDKPPLKPPTAEAPAAAGKKKPTPEPYNRARYYRYAADKSKSFNELYGFCFTLAKAPQSRNIDMETATAFWSVLIQPRYTIMQDIIGFIQEKDAYKGVNKDIWHMVLEFCQTISPTLENYEDDGAWPTMLDEFVTWKKQQAGDAAKAQ